MLHTSTVHLADIPGVGGIVACQCGHFHLSLGAMTLSFSASEFKAVAYLFDCAMKQLPVLGADNIGTENISTQRTQ